MNPRRRWTETWVGGYPKMTFTETIAGGKTPSKADELNLKNLHDGKKFVQQCHRRYLQ
jgi:hypothetical protein